MVSKVEAEQLERWLDRLVLEIPGIVTRDDAWKHLGELIEEKIKAGKR